MGQKTHPLGFRIGITQNHRSLWFANSQDYSKSLEEDYKIRHFIEKKLPNANISDISIYKKIDQIEIKIRTARPGIGCGEHPREMGLVHPWNGRCARCCRARRWCWAAASPPCLGR